MQWSARMAIVPLMVLLTSCSPRYPSAALDKYATATLIAGTGLGDLRLGETTLDEFVRTFGKGQYSLAISDESAFEFAYFGGAVAFQFLIEGQCLKEIIGTRDLRRAAPDLEAYLVSHPGCRELPLSSISVTSRSFFKGATDKGVKLGEPITTSNAHGEGVPAKARVLAGMSPDNPDNAIEYPGIVFHYDGGSTGNLETATIRRITVFRVGK